MSLAICVVMIDAVCATRTVAADSFSVREFISLKSDWPKYASQNGVITINGRFAGRIARQFRLANLPMMILPERTTALPADVDSGERVTVTGVLTKAGSRYQFLAQRIAIGASDGVRLRSQIRELPDGGYKEAYQLATHYDEIASFYEDDLLQSQVQALRASTFAKERAAASNDPQRLRELVGVAGKLGLSEDIQRAVQFESILRLSRQKSASNSQILERIRNELAGWDDSSQVLTAQQKRAFLKNPVATYEGLLPEKRPPYHRLLYRTVRLKEILKTEKSDGSNGNEIAERIREELPEEVAAISKANESYVTYRLEAVPRLSRRQLSELEELLTSLGRRNDFDKALQDWLTAQEKRLNNQQLDGLLETADQYLFAFERWKNQSHGDTGIKFLKRSWSMASGAAPEEAAKIETRLEQLGWVRLRNQWMTTEDVAAIPETDADLAMKEGRVVGGMKTAQVLAILGEPGRRIRVASKGKVQEVWVYGSGESSGITIHLSRRSFDSPSSAVVTKVGRSRR